MDHEFMRRLHGGAGWEKITHRIALKAKAEIATDTMLFVFEKPVGFTYRAGQHVRMSFIDAAGLNPDEQFRFWSFASAPFEPDLSFAVRMRLSPFKTALASLPIGADVQIDMLKKPPHGAFALDDHANPVLFLAGGIGVVPAFSMIKQALHDGSKRPLTFLYSTHLAANAPFLTQLLALADASENLTVLPTLTDRNGQTGWNGLTGRISRKMLEDQVPAIRKSTVYISGLKAMVEGLRREVSKLGVSKSAIHAEEFGSFNPIGARRKKGKSGTVSTILIALIGLAIVAAHALPIWALMQVHLPAKLPDHLWIYGLALVAAVIVLKILFFSNLHRRRH